MAKVTVTKEQVLRRSRTDDESSPHLARGVGAASVAERSAEFMNSSSAPYGLAYEGEPLPVWANFS
jgi:hypothetical protein